MQLYVAWSSIEIRSLILIQWRSYGLYGSNPEGIKIKHMLQYQVCDTDSYEPLGLIPILNRSTIIAQLCSSWECFCHPAPCHCTIVYFSDPIPWYISQYLHIVDDLYSLVFWSIQPIVYKCQPCLYIYVKILFNFFVITCRTIS